LQIVQMSHISSREDRKKLRIAQRELADTLKKETELLQDPHSKAFDIYRQKTNEQCQSVLHAREFQYDTQNVKELAKSVENVAGHLVDIGRRYDFSSFASSLRNQYDKGTANSFSWSDYGRDIGVVSRKRQELCTMFGPVG
jgi:hypothetical protein